VVTLPAGLAVWVRITYPKRSIGKLLSKYPEICLKSQKSFYPIEVAIDSVGKHSCSACPRFSDIKDRRTVNAVKGVE
jgi:hypothetical protein